MINGGLSVPNLEAWFTPPYLVACMKILEGGQGVFWKVYFQVVPAATHLTLKSIEVAVFFNVSSM